VATKYIQEYASEADFLADAVDAPSRVGFAAVSEVVVINKAGSVVEVVDETATQTLTNKTLTSPTINGGVGTAPSEVVTATNVITAAESGTTFYLSALAGFLSTLPAPALGLNYRFIVKTAPTSNGYTIGTTGGSDVIFGMAHERAGGAGVAGSAEDLITLVANQSIPGDFVDVHSDGTNWYARASVDVAAGITFTVT
jgi:hypothetical protein